MQEVESEQANEQEDEEAAGARAEESIVQTDDSRSTRREPPAVLAEYARAVLDRKDISYGRKVREAVLAMKIKEQYDNDTILQMYLNTVYFGRSAYGIEAAAVAYFNKQAKDLTQAEGMVLAGVIKQPVGNDGVSGSPYDPTADPASAKARFDYIKNNMVKLKYLSAADAAAMQYPANVVAYNPKNVELRAQWGMDQPSGLIVHHVMDEIWKLTTPTGEKRFTNIRNGGLKIVTTIDRNMQKAAVDAADFNSATFKAQKFKDPTELRAALVAVEPGTGQVKAYYGGPDGKGTDYAGIYQDPVTTPNEAWSQGGAHPPGSSMKIYTMAAGLVAGYQTDSIWDATQREFPKSGRGKNNPVKNSSTPQCALGATACTLDESVWESLNTPLFALTEMITSTKVVELAKAAGVRFMWNDKGDRIDLQTLESKAIPTHFNTEVGIGQYGITPLEHAAGVATIAARGQSAKAHFIDKVYKNGEPTPVYSGAVGTKAVPGLSSGMTDDMSATLMKVVDHYKVTVSGRELAGKSGTWQLGDTTDNAHAWFVGYSGYDPSKKANGLSAAVWLGNRKDLKPLKFATGKSIIGGEGSGKIWQAFMKAALASAPKVKFSGAKGTGSIKVGNGKEPVPSTPPDQNQQPGDGQNNGPGNNQPSTPAQPNASQSRRNN